jgi:hypothetical protein
MKTAAVLLALRTLKTSGSMMALVLVLFGYETSSRGAREGWIIATRPMAMYDAAAL